MDYHKNYYTENKEKILNQVKEYKKANIERIKLKNKEYKERHKHEQFVCECGGIYTYNHKARHLKTAKHQKNIANSTP
jgi:hypothetical protein